MKIESTGQKTGLVMVGHKVGTASPRVQPVPPIDIIGKPFDRNMYYQMFQSKKGGSSMSQIGEKELKSLLEDAMKEVDSSSARTADEIYREGMVDIRRTVNFLRVWVKANDGTRSARKALSLIQGLNAIECDVSSTVVKMGIIHEKKIIKQLVNGATAYCQVCGRETAVDNPGSAFAHCMECGNEIKEVRV